MGTEAVNSKILLHRAVHHLHCPFAPQAEPSSSIGASACMHVHKHRVQCITAAGLHCHPCTDCDADIVPACQWLRRPKRGTRRDSRSAAEKLCKGMYAGQSGSLRRHAPGGVLHALSVKKPLSHLVEQGSQQCRQLRAPLGPQPHLCMSVAVQLKGQLQALACHKQVYSHSLQP